MFGLKKRKQLPIKTERKIFHGVAVVPGAAEACSAVLSLCESRYLADDAPMLPLEGCDNPAACTCRYEHFDDRRTQLRRDSDVGMPMKDHPQDARFGVGRRVTDG